MVVPMYPSVENFSASGVWLLMPTSLESKPCNVGPKSYLRNVAQRGANVSHY